jgi:hypothetical protein
MQDFPLEVFIPLFNLVDTSTAMALFMLWEGHLTIAQKFKHHLMESDVATMFGNQMMVLIGTL